MTYTFHADPGHAWLEVTLTDVLAVGLQPKQFSPYSYKDIGRSVTKLYLEEDCDAGLFIGAWEAKNPGQAFPMKDKHSDSDSFVRRLPSIRA